MLGKETEGYTGADLKNLCNQAGINALRKQQQVGLYFLIAS